MSWHFWLLGLVSPAEEELERRRQDRREKGKERKEEKETRLIEKKEGNKETNT